MESAELPPGSTLISDRGMFLTSNKVRPLPAVTAVRATQQETVYMTISLCTMIRIGVTLVNFGVDVLGANVIYHAI